VDEATGRTQAQAAIGVGGEAIDQSVDSAKNAWSRIDGIRESDERSWPALYRLIGQRGNSYAPPAGGPAGLCLLRPRAEGLGRGPSA
jgi:hypothetical protein